MTYPNRIDRPRFDVHGNVLSTFWPRGCNRYNCRIGALFQRKRRGPRRQGRAYKLAEGERKRAMIAKFTPEELMYLVAAVTADLKNRPCMTRLDRRAEPTFNMFRKPKP